MKCREYRWEISDGTGPLTLLLTRHSLWPPRSETAINPAAAPEMLETEALKKVVIISGCAHEHPNNLAFKKQNIHHASQSGETLSNLQKRALPPNTAVMKHQGLNSPRKPLGAMLISHPRTQLPGAVLVSWSPQPSLSLLCLITQEQPSPSKNTPMLPEELHSGAPVHL